MITYTNTVLVSNAGSAAIVAKNASEVTGVTNGKFVILTDGAATTAAAKKIKVGVGVDGGKKIKWSNWIQKEDVRDYTYSKYASTKHSEDEVIVDFTKIGSDSAVMTDIAVGGISITLRLTFKDLPTRFRNWTESYNYVTLPGDDATKIAKAFEKTITDQKKRARVDAVADSGKLTLTAMEYDDDNSNDTINVANKVRFNVTAYFTNPNLPAFASSNKYALTTAEDFIKKTEGKQFVGEGKLVRDRESEALGNEGILNRGMCTWPIIKPAMVADYTANYNVFTLQFENSYRAADDITRRTKQGLEIDLNQSSTNEDVIKKLIGFVTGTEPTGTTVNDTDGVVVVRN